MIEAEAEAEAEKEQEQEEKQRREREGRRRFDEQGQDDGDRRDSGEAVGEEETEVVFIEKKR